MRSVFLTVTPCLFIFSTSFSSAVRGADTAESQVLSAGVWANYQYLPDDERNQNSWGEFNSEALILYADGDAGENGKWLYSAELRIGPGSFTDPANNSSQDSFSLHKAWVGWQLNDNHTLRVGKSQVPFGWKTVNFWPGDILLAGYGDQMDVGAKFSGALDRFAYDGAFYLADDWGSNSTDTVDDNGHWGSANTYRKVQTWVGNLSYEFIDDHKLAVSLQSGGLQDLLAGGEGEVDGDHSGYVIYYHGIVDDFYMKLSYIDSQRELPERYAAANPTLNPRISNQRLAAEFHYDLGRWSFYANLSQAMPDTGGNTAANVYAVAPGLKYNYGPGWVYIETLKQNGFVNRDGVVGEGDFDALYVSLDFYL